MNTEHKETPKFARSCSVRITRPSLGAVVWEYEESTGLHQSVLAWRPGPGATERARAEAMMEEVKRVLSHRFFPEYFPPTVRRKDSCFLEPEAGRSVPVD